MLIAVWGLALGGGFWRLLNYSNTPGLAATEMPSRWPFSTKLVRETGKPTLLVFAHPQCPCSKATIGELERLMPHIQGKVVPIVVFVKPKKMPPEWATDGLWQKAVSIPGVTAVLDEDGAEATQFDAKTSGQVYLYDKKGDLIFHGGITPERGHMGDSDGREAILTFVATGHTNISTTRVFGCSLKKPERAIAGVKQ